jgi:hypothetical protein
VEMLTLIGALCYVAFIKPIAIATGVQRQGIALSVGPNLVCST